MEGGRALLETEVPSDLSSTTHKPRRCVSAGTVLGQGVTESHLHPTWTPALLSGEALTASGEMGL